jgi:hypothetical protein
VARHFPGHAESTEQVDAATAEVLAAFEAAGVDALLLKGPALAALLYTAGEQRSYSDTDLLVVPSQIDAAESALRALGYSNADSVTVTGVDDVGGVVHAHTWMRMGSPDHSMIDLHHWLAGAEASPIAAWEALVVRRTWIQVGGRRAAVLGRAGQAVHLALHAAQHGPAYGRPLDELALALERWSADVWDAAAELAEEIGATPAFAAGLRLLPRGAIEAARLGLPATAELDWKIKYKATRPRGAFHVQALAEADGLADKLGILRGSLFPRRAWIERHYPWARRRRLRLIAAYGVHLVRAPVWAARAWRFRTRARRSRRPR